MHTDLVLTLAIAGLPTLDANSLLYDPWRFQLLAHARFSAADDQAANLPKPFMTNSDMDLTTTKGIEDYLRSKQIPFDKLTAVSSGNINFTWRVEASHGQETVIKHAEPYVKDIPSMLFPVERMDLEVKAISLPEVQSFSNIGHNSMRMTICTPHILFYDSEKYVLQMSFGGSRTFKEAYTDNTINIQEWAEMIGTWLANFHLRTRLTEFAKTKMGRFAYNNLGAVFQEYGHDRGLAERINSKYGSLLATDDDCICHGDYWPGNILVSEDKTTLTVIDWETARRGCGAVDVGHFAAESYLLDTLRGDKELLKNFLQAYRDSIGPDKLTLYFVERVAAHFGVHLGFWPAQNESEYEHRGQIAHAVQTSVDILTLVDAQDWARLRTSVLRDLFVENRGGTPI